MEEEQVIPAVDGRSKEKDKSPVKKIFLVIGIVLTFIIFGVILFLLGKRSAGNLPETSPTPQPTEVIIPTISEEPSPPEATESSNLKLSPTKTPAPSPTPIAKTKIINSTASLDGFRSSNGGGNETLEIRSGRNNNLVTRGFVSFNISSLPNDAKVQEAKLRLYQAKVIGNPISLLGALKIDHLTYGDSLDKSDYGAAALSSSFATLTTNTKIEWKEIDVTDAVKNDVSNARSLSQFRIHFQTETTGGDEIGDFVYFEASENNLKTGNTPQLVVKYN